MFLPLLSSITEYVLPHRCATCSTLTENSDGLCSKCFSKLNFVTSPYCDICGVSFDFEMDGRFSCGKCILEAPKYNLGRALFQFDNESKKVIHAFKYNDKTIYAKMFAKLLVARYRADVDGADLIVPVPMNRFKRIFRNYNPPQILSKEISKILEVPMVPDLLIKTKWTKPQTALEKIERAQNLRDSLKINKKYNIKGKKILLVDDVRTTGTTANTCSKLLKKAGAIQVDLLTIGAVD